MMKNPILLITLLIIFTLSCKEEKASIVLNNSENLVFGHSYGYCFGSNCVKTFLINENKLYLAKDPQYASCPDLASFDVLADSSYQKVKELTAKIPNALWNEPEGAIGMPDAYDQGGYQVQLTIDGKSKCWFIDTDKKNIPTYLHEFIAAIGENLIELKE